MEYRVEGTNIDSTELGNGEWETILRLRKKYRPSTADNSLPHSGGLIGQMECSGSDGRRTTQKSQDGTPTPSRPSPPPPPPRLLRRTPLPQLPKGDFKVVVRPRGGLDVTKQTPRTLLTAIASATEVSLQEALAQDQLRLHPTNNTFTLSTPVEDRARAYAQLTSILLGGSRTDVTAYLAPPDDAVRCIIHMAYNDERHREILEGACPLQPGPPNNRCSTIWEEAIPPHHPGHRASAQSYPLLGGHPYMFSSPAKSRSVLQLPPHRAPPRRLSGPSQWKLSQLRRPSRPDPASNMLTEVYRLRGQAPHRER
ncbi:hypothetical protein MTO96_026216 [Rhipicephalus appendiculatus]